ncbi:hypothetical protein L6164_021660 [Bauhinia variegata]|uniref:Uncharacterized protein n=1 Tax=Bauhinia variegata TaxID=167791 RepID=A0ACB9MZ70_BAUVA|nr:hypothetical protein L6164_021660 [Bauhinia variegata]
MVLALAFKPKHEKFFGKFKEMGTNFAGAIEDDDSESSKGKMAILELKVTSPQTEREKMLRERELKDIGDELLKTPSSSVNKLLQCLEKLDGLLSNMSQNEKTNALLPAMKALISSNILRHSEEVVRIWVTSCITEIARITAPDPPFNDDLMKEIFQLTLAAFEKLSDDSDPCYEKAISILENVSLMRSSAVMLDLECDDLILQMFQSFIRIIRLNNSDQVCRNIKTIMTTVLEESEDVSSDLLGTLLDSLIKDNQTLSPESWALAEQVIAECSHYVKPYIYRAVQSRGRDLDCYAEIVTSICHSQENSNANGMELVAEGLKSNVKDASGSAMNAETVKEEVPKRQQQQHSDLSKDSKSNAKPGSESFKDSKSEPLLDTLPKKRGRKPNSLKNPDEGYKYLMSRERRSPRSAQCRKTLDRVPSENLERQCVVCLPRFDEDGNLSLPAVEGSSSVSLISQRRLKRGWPKRRKSAYGQDAEPLLESTSKENLSKASLELPGIRTERDSEVIKDAEVEPQPSTRKTTVDETRSETLSEENIEEGRTLVLTNATLNKDLNESSSNKELISESATKGRPRRKITAAQDETHWLVGGLRCYGHWTRRIIQVLLFLMTAERRNTRSYTMITTWKY